ncbi:MAG: hypothetical protein U9Q83_12155 [Bacteroidota bacterium]|nr:hypothetical protein [Bacteroidota bacterium]
MLDTTVEMIQKQREIFFSKTSNERFLIGAETIAFGRVMVESSIKQKEPEISELDLKISVFKRYYENFYTNNELEKIINSMIYYYLHREEILKSTQHAT